MRASRRALLAAKCLLLVFTISGCAVLCHGASATSLVLGRTRGQKATSSTTEGSNSDLSEAQERIDGDTAVVDSSDSTTVATTITVNGTTKHVLTGNPQIDYKYDPNLPRELKGYDLSNYPFYHTLPENMDFKCDGLHDGFYASVPHKCQVYHHCLFGTRYDFLCANYTAFDQTTFICHFVSEVDCVNSPKFYGRNSALYKQDTTTTTTTSTTPSPDGAGDNYRVRPVAGGGGGGGRRRRPQRPKPIEYDEDYYEDYEEEPPKRSRPRRPGRTRRPEYDYEDEVKQTPSAPAQKSPPPKVTSPGEEPPLPSKPSRDLFEKPRAPPRIRPPVPVNEREKFLRPGEDIEPEPRNNKQASKSEDSYDEEYDEPPRKKNKKPLREEDDTDFRPRKKPASYDDYDGYDVVNPDEDFRRTPTLTGGGRRRNRNGGRRRPPSRYDDYDDDYRDYPRRKRPIRRPYEDDYDDEYPEQPRRRNKRPRPINDDVSGSSSIRSRTQVRPHYDYDDEEPVRPRKQQRKSTTTTTTTTTEKPTTTTRKSINRKATSTTPIPYDEYYDEYKEEEIVPSQAPTTTTTTKKTQPVAVDFKPEPPTEKPAEETTTTRKPFVPKAKSTVSPDQAKTTLKFAPFKFSSLDEASSTEDPKYEFKIEDYVKQTTRPPFVPRNRNAAPQQPSVTTSTTTTTTTENPIIKEQSSTAVVRPPSRFITKAPAKTIETYSQKPTSQEDDYPENIKPRTSATSGKLLPPLTDTDYPEKTRVPNIDKEVDYPEEIKSKTPSRTQPPSGPSVDYPENIKPRQQYLTRVVPASKLANLPERKIVPTPPEIPSAPEDYLDYARTQTGRKPESVGKDEDYPSRINKQEFVSRTPAKTVTTYRDTDVGPQTFKPRFKPSVPDFTSPGDESAYLVPPPRPSGKVGTPPSDIASKAPAAPPPRSRLSTSFLPRGLSPVGSARTKSTSTTTTTTTTTTIPDDEYYDDYDAINDALHPTGADTTSTISSQVYYQPRTNNGIKREEPTTASSKLVRDDRSRYNTQVDQPYPTTALETFARQPSAPSSFRAAAGIRQQQQQQSQPQQQYTSRNERLSPAASVQFSTHHQPAPAVSTSWASRDYYYTY